ncbi:MAG: chorismate mutase [Pseudobdellovibrionaceae bacterium]
MKNTPSSTPAKTAKDAPTTSPQAAALLKPFRAQIDVLDDQIVDLLVKRMAVIRDVAPIKAENGIPAVLDDRIEEIINRVAERAGEENEDMICEIYAVLLAVSCDVEEELMGQGQKFRD